MVVRLNKAPLAHIKGELETITVQILRLLYLLAGVAIVSQLSFSLAYGIKALLIFGVALMVARETEIFFTTQKSNVPRAEAKETLKTTKPEITALVYALLLPVGTPLFVTAVGAFVAIFIGKMVFGGYSFNVFNPAIVGRLFVGMAWPALVTIPFSATFDNYILGFLIANPTQEILSPLMQMREQGIVTLQGAPSMTALLFLPSYGMLSSIPAAWYLLLGVYLFVKKLVDLRPLLFTLLATTLMLVVIASGHQLPLSYVLVHLLAGGLLFVALFMMTDPITKPYTSYGILFYTLIFTVVFMMIRFLGKDSDGVLYALLFANIFVPLLNKKCVTLELGRNRQTVIAVLIALGVLVGAGLFITKIVDERIANNSSVVR